MSSSGSTSPPPFPEIEERWGENPARLLIRNLNPRPRLRAIDDVDQLRDWRTVEERCRDRRRVLEMIDQRIRAVETDADDHFVAEKDVDQPVPDPTPDARGSTDTAAVTDGGTDATADSGTASGTASGNDDPDYCPDCGSEQVKTEELADQRALWCRSCSDFVARLGGASS